MIAIIWPSGSFSLSPTAPSPAPDGAVVLDFPAELAGLQPEAIVWDGTVLRRKADIWLWYIDAMGQKWPTEAAGRQALACAPDARVLKDGTGWSVQTRSDRLAPLVKAECGRRILAVASTKSQMNMTATQAAGLLTDADKAAYIAALGWVAEMRGKCSGLIAGAVADYGNDTYWPAVPPGVAALAARF